MAEFSDPQKVRSPNTMTAPALVMMLAFAACGGGSSSPTQPTPTTNTPPPAPPTSRSTENPVGSSTNVEARTSQTNADGSQPTQVFDDFTFTGGATIRTVAWQGIYCVQQANAPIPNPTATGFVIGLYPDTGGLPNIQGALQTSTFTLAQSNQVFDRNQAALMCGTAANTTWAFYRYSATLATPFVAAAGTKYWISVQATTPSYAVFWGWRDGTVDNRSSVQLFSGQFTNFSVDRAYSLQP